MSDRGGMLLVYALLAVATTWMRGSVAMAKSRTQASRACRHMLGSTFWELARLGFRDLDACASRASRAKPTRDCTTLPPASRATDYHRWAYRTRAFIGARCAQDDPARAPFPARELADGSVVGDPTLSIDDVGALVERSAEELENDSAAATTGRATAACGRVVASTRSQVALRVMRDALRCQRRRDARAAVFDVLDPGCESYPRDRVVRKAAGRIARACGALSGAAAGTCEPLPSCVIDVAAATGVALARATYGQCGNGVLDAGEDCDDGNVAPDDGCTGCRAARCGNGRVEGGEECDDGNLLDHDTCTQCRNPLCGDGIHDVGAEECDDGNDVAADGCTDCSFDAVPCSAEGIFALVSFEYDPNQFGDIAGLRLRVQYPPDLVSIPGSLVAPTVTQRVTNLTGLTNAIFGVADRDLLPSEESPDGVDDTVQTLVAVAQGQRVPSGAFEQIRFDCAAGTTALSSRRFTCIVVEASDPFTNAYGEDAIAQGTRCSIRLQSSAAP